MLVKSVSLSKQTAWFNLPPLPYAADALAPAVSRQTLAFHHGKHLKAYVDKLNALLPGTELEQTVLEEIVAQAPAGPLFNNAGQVLNHELYFEQFRPSDGSGAAVPAGPLAEAIDRAFGSFDGFKQQMNAAGTALFGSGWVWLAEDIDGHLSVLSCPNADNPVRHGMVPVLGFDVWEHAYYLDYQNRRADHLEALWTVVDWDVVASRLR